MIFSYFAGGVAGVVIGAALEEAKKAELRKQMLNTATEGVINIILELEKLAVGMLDQYSLLLMGNERSPSKLDLATDQLRSKIRLLHNNAQNLFRKTVDFNKILDQVKEPENDAEILNTKYVYGSGGYTAEEKKKIGSKKLWIMRGYASLGLFIFGGTVVGIMSVPIVYFKKSKP